MREVDRDKGRIEHIIQAIENVAIMAWTTAISNLPELKPMMLAILKELE